MHIGTKWRKLAQQHGDHAAIIDDRGTWSYRDVHARIARQYLDGELDFPRASEALEREALMPSADATLKFLNRFRSYGATYTIGRDALSRYLDTHSTAGDPASRWRA